MIAYGNRKKDLRSARLTVITHITALQRLLPQKELTLGGTQKISAQGTQSYDRGPQGSSDPV